MILVGEEGRVTNDGATVIIPAHNESLVIEECLASLLEQDHQGALRVVVVANGCGDATLERARSFAGRFAERGWALRATAIQEASKPAALNRGDKLAAPGIRIYLDADVVLSRNALSAVVALLQPASGAEFASPALRVARSRSRCTRNYGRVWASLPYVSGDVIGLGFYAVSARGRKRWGSFPPIVADDKFARLHFSERERRIATDASFTVFMPEGLRELVRVRSRWIRANAELARGFPDLARFDRRRLGGLLRYLATNPRAWPSLPLFLLMYSLAEIRASGPRRRQPVWERADRARSERGRRSEGLAVVGAE